MGVYRRRGTVRVRPGVQSVTTPHQVDYSSLRGGHGSLKYQSRSVGFRCTRCHQGSVHCDLDRPVPVGTTLVSVRPLSPLPPRRTPIGSGPYPTDLSTGTRPDLPPTLGALDGPVVARQTRYGSFVLIPRRPVTTTHPATGVGSTGPYDLPVAPGLDTRPCPQDTRHTVPPSTSTLLRPPPDCTGDTVRQDVRSG